MAAFDDAVILWDPGVDGGRSSDLVGDVDSDAGLTEGTWTNDEGYAGRTFTGATGSRFTVSQASQADHTIMFLLKRNATGNQWGGLAAGAENQRYAQAGVESDNWRVQSRMGNAGGWPTASDTTNLDLAVHVLMSRYEHATETIELWLDGTLEATNTGSTGDSAGTYNRFTVGRLDRSSAINSTNLSVYAAALWDRKLTDLEMAEVSAAPRAYLLPDQPTGVAAVANGENAITVSWTDVTGETGYRVERSPNGTGSWTNVSGTLAANTVSYQNTGLTAGTTYYYRVVAINGAGDSTPSAVVNATTTSAASGNRIGGTGAIRRSGRR